MTDRRTVGDLTVEELEQVLVLKRRALRRERLRRLAQFGRVVDDLPLPGEKASEWAPDKETAGPELSGTADVYSHRSRFRAVEYGAVPDSEAQESKPPTEQRSRSFRDRVLLGLEVLALVGLVVILAGSLINLRTLNEEVAQAREAPTPTATPLIQVSILPGGSSPPVAADDIPLAYRNLVRSMPSMEVPTPSPQQPTRLIIPSIQVDTAVVQGDSWEDLKKGAGHHAGSMNPGQRGNMIISAHNDVFGEIFRRLDQVELEDKITIQTRSQTFNYIVKAKRVVDPTDVSVMAPTSRPILTLITCYPYLVDTHRLVVIAQLDR